MYVFAFNNTASVYMYIVLLTTMNAILTLFAGVLRLVLLTLLAKLILARPLSATLLPTIEKNTEEIIAELPSSWDHDSEVSGFPYTCTCVSFCAVTVTHVP